MNEKQKQRIEEIGKHSHDFPTTSCSATLALLGIYEELIAVNETLAKLVPTPLRVTDPLDLLGDDEEEEDETIPA